MLKSVFFPLFVLLSFLFKVEAQETLESKKKTICLNMIVKNEGKVILKCLGSVKHLIDYWVIVDTGSTDGTQEIIKNFMAGVPGELHERPWVDFAHNRNEALSFAKGKGNYILFMDADEKLVCSDEFTSFPVGKDYYFITLRGSDPNYATYNRFALVNNHLPWTWKDVIHEYLVVPSNAQNGGVLSDVFCFTDCDGFRSQDPKKYYKDAAVLEKALEKDPTNSRYVFYLAQSYYNAKEYELAIQYYLKRASMGNGPEASWSAYGAAYLQQMLNKPSELFIRNYEEAFQKDPVRAEPFFRLAEYFNKNNNYILGYLLSKQALTLSKPIDRMYVQEWIYEYGLLKLLGESAFALGKYDEALKTFQLLLSAEKTPKDVKEEARFYLSRKELLQISNN